MAWQTASNSLADNSTLLQCFVKGVTFYLYLHLECHTDKLTFFAIFQASKSCYKGKSILSQSIIPSITKKPKAAFSLSIPIYEAWLLTLHCF